MTAFLLETRSIINTARGATTGQTTRAAKRKIWAAAFCIFSYPQDLSVAHTTPSENCWKANINGMQAKSRCSGRLTAFTEATPMADSTAPLAKLASAEKHISLLLNGFAHPNDTTIRGWYRGEEIGFYRDTFLSKIFVSLSPSGGSPGPGRQSRCPGTSSPSPLHAHSRHNGKNCCYALFHIGSRLNITTHK